MTTKFQFTETIAEARVISAKLGTATSAKMTDADVGKCVKLGAIGLDNYVLCADQDDIEGFLVSVEPFTIDGYSFGSVQVNGRKAVTLDGTVAFGALVVCGTIVALNTALASAGAVKVKTGTAASAAAAVTQSGTTPFAVSAVAVTLTARKPATHLWRVISALSTDTTTAAVIERIGS